MAGTCSECGATSEIETVTFGDTVLVPDADGNVTIPDPNAVVDPPTPAFADSADCLCATRRHCPLVDDNGDPIVDVDGRNVTGYEVCDYDGRCGHRIRLDLLLEHLTTAQSDVICRTADAGNHVLVNGGIVENLSTDAANPSTFTFTTTATDGVQAIDGVATVCWSDYFELTYRDAGIIAWPTYEILVGGVVQKTLTQPTRFIQEDGPNPSAIFRIRDGQYSICCPGIDVTAGNGVQIRTTVSAFNYQPGLGPNDFTRVAHVRREWSYSTRPETVVICP